MLVFRIICAILLAWAMNWALSRSEAVPLLQELPELASLVPIAAATVGYFNLSVRQGWGFIVAFANGVWAGVLSLVIGGVLYLLVRSVQAIRTDVVQDFDSFLRVFSDAAEPVLLQMLSFPLLTVALGATAVVGVLTEVLHWVLVRFREKRGKQSSTT